MMISKERFIKILKFIQDQESKQDKFIEALMKVIEEKCR